MNVRNIYATIGEIKARLGISVTTYDDLLGILLEAASREIDAWCRRHFYTTTGIVYCDTVNTDQLILPNDCLSVTEFVTDSELDGTYDGESWVAQTDYYLWPYESYPKLQARLSGFGDYSFPENTRRYVQITGIWGYGDGTSDPWELTAITGTAATADGTTLTLSAEGVIEAGQTIKAGDEQMYVSAVSEAEEVYTATVVRGVNGTTAAVQAGPAISIACYPGKVRQMCLILAAMYYRRKGSDDVSEKTIGTYRFRRIDTAEVKELMVRILGSLRRITF